MLANWQKNRFVNEQIPSYNHSQRLKTIFLLIFYIVLNSFGSMELYGQAPTKKVPSKSLQLYQSSQKDIQNQNFSTAKIKLREAIRLFPYYGEAHHALADILRISQQYDSAVIHYELVIQNTEQIAPFTYFGLGESLLGQGLYEKSQLALRKYLESQNEPKSTYPTNSANKDPYFLTKKYLDDATFSLNYIKNQVASHSEWDITPLGPEINTGSDEYFPHFTADFQKLIFTRKVNEEENFYESDFNFERNGTIAQLLEGRINSKEFNEGAHCISPDGKYIFFTGCNRPGGLGSCDIYVSKRENGRWSEPFNLGAPINTNGWEAQPSISADGKTLYFVSNRSGGFGGYDIWKSSLLNNGKWSNPVNLGPKINTALDESAPYIHADNQTLFFTSNGWPGFGKKDFFQAKMDINGDWNFPINLGNALNDHRDQSSLIISMKGNLGVFASQRDLNRKDLDLYYFKVPEHLRPIPVSYLKGLVVDSNSLNYLSAQITVFDLSGEELIYRGTSDLDDGQFLIPLETGKRYTLHVEKTNYLLFSEHFELTDSINTKDAYALVVPLKKIAVGKQEVLKNVFFELNKAELLESSYFELNALVDFLQKNPTINIEIGGHTDNTGSNEYNQNLSQQRAKAVWQYMIDRGVATDRLKYRGFGATLPIADNDSPEGRQKNRRTDFKVITY